jgi:DNA (cytosine-5)-methyltransferase 1
MGMVAQPSPTNNTLHGKRPIVIDLFAGAGGLSLGFEQAGFDIAASVEVDPIHSATHHYNFPYSATICRSVVGLSGAEVRRLSAIGTCDVDVVCGGAPCQGFSTIGKRALDDPRNQLVAHYCRLVRELNPKFAVFENVRGLTMGAHKAFLDELIETLSSGGYRVLLPYRVLNAADYGVPQDRKRLFLIAARRGQTLPSYPKSRPGVTVHEAIGDLPDADAFDSLVDCDHVTTRLGRGSDYARQLRGELLDEADFGHPRAWDRRLLTSSTRTAHTALSRQRFAQTPNGRVEPISRFLKLAPGGVCNTLRAGTDSARGAFTSPRPIHPSLPRVITVREAARLHSYPDWFRFHATKWHGFRQIGNSVPPLLARAVAAQLIAAMGVEPSKPVGEKALGTEAELNYTMADAVRRFGLGASPIANRIRVVEPATDGTRQQRDLLVEESAGCG